MIPKSDGASSIDEEPTNHKITDFHAATVGCATAAAGSVLGDPPTN